MNLNSNILFLNGFLQESHKSTLVFSGKLSNRTWNFSSILLLGWGWVGVGVAIWWTSEGEGWIPGDTAHFFVSFTPPSFTLPVLLLIFSPSIGLDTSWPLVFAGRRWGVINRWPSSWLRPGEVSWRTTSCEGCWRSVCAWIQRSDLWRSPALCGWTRGALRRGLCVLLTTIPLQKHTFGPERKMNGMFFTYTTV